MRAARTAGARARRGASLLVLGLACHPASARPPDAGTTAAASSADTRGQRPPAPTAAEPVPCGPAGERFEDHGWVPAGAAAVASVEVDAPALPAALGALAEHVRAPGHGLPIPLAFSLGQWSWQIPALVATLGQAGFHPAELVLVRDEVDAAWVWRSTCDLDEAVARIEAAWSVRARRTVEGIIATPGPAAAAGTPAFPYDVLLLPGERMAVVPAGRGSAVLGRLGRPAAVIGLSGAPVASAGRRLDALAPAPVRLVVLGRGLLDPAAATADHEALALRATADGVQGPGASGDASLPLP
jgi:hypothetical protein